ncbi:hypothetical protein IG631_02230 [Alternaria alternata]|jgi:hypothetical protein|nr:hypothetical protein IG631_02230 [Alternaria alternata]
MPTNRPGCEESPKRYGTRRAGQYSVLVVRNVRTVWPRGRTDGCIRRNVYGKRRRSTGRVFRSGTCGADPNRVAGVMIAGAGGRHNRSNHTMWANWPEGGQRRCISVHTPFDDGVRLFTGSRQTHDK